MNILGLFGEPGPKKSLFSGRLGLGVRFNYLKLASCPAFRKRSNNFPSQPPFQVSSLMTKQRYRKDLRKAALRRAAAVLRSQKPLPARKGGNKKASAKKD